MSHRRTPILQGIKNAGAVANRALPLALVCLLLLTGIVGSSAQQSQVEYWASNEPKALQPVKSAPVDAKLMTLKDLPLVLKEPVTVELGDSAYSLDQEGLYRFREKGKVVRQTILYKGDVWRLAGHLDRLYVYGTRHQQDGGPEKWDERARNGEPISLQCGMIAVFVITHLSEQGIPARMVQCFNGTDWHGYDDGHVMMEFRHPVEKRWVLFDSTLGARFRKGGRWLDLLDMTQLYRAGGRADQIEFVNGSSKIDPLMDYEGFYSGYFTDKQQLATHLGNFKLALNNDAEAIHKWYTRMMQIPLYAYSFVPGSDAEDALIRTIRGFEKLERMTPAQFRARFYPVG